MSGQGMSFADDIEKFVYGSDPITVETLERFVREHYRSLPDDVVAEVTSRFDLNLTRFAFPPIIGAQKAAAHVARKALRYARRRHVCYDVAHPHHGVCQDPARCTVRGHARAGRWAGQPYVPGWLRAIAERIERHHARSGVEPQCQIIVLTTGPTDAEDGSSTRDMIAAAKSFTRVAGFRWDHLLSSTNPRRKADRRIIRYSGADFLLEARVELVPSGVAPSTLAYQSSMDSVTIPDSSVCQTITPLWTVRWLFAYYGPPLDQDAVSRLEKRWRKHPRNRGRAHVSCSFQSMLSSHAALNRIQLYRLAGLDLPGPERAMLDYLRADSGIRRVFRLGAGRRQLAFAKKLWKDALAITDRQMLAAAVANEPWAKAIVGARDWREAMRKLKDKHDRELAHRYRWKHRRETVYPGLLRQGL